MTEEAGMRGNNSLRCSRDDDMLKNRRWFVCLAIRGKGKVCGEMKGRFVRYNAGYFIVAAGVWQQPYMYECFFYLGVFCFGKTRIGCVVTSLVLSGFYREVGGGEGVLGWLFFVAADHLSLCFCFFRGEGR